MQSMETILTVKNKNADAQSDWSIVWSTANVPGMDRATGAGSTHRKTGRRRLRLAGLALGFMLTMHCRVTAMAFTTGYFVTLLLLTPTVWLLANPLRHFEVYLGQWSLNGPGRAFRIIPMLDGIGMTICGHALIKAIISATIAAITLIYVVQSSSDKPLGSTYCRTTDLVHYEPEIRDVQSFKIKSILELIGLDEQARRNLNVTTKLQSDIVDTNETIEMADNKLKERRKSHFCKETFSNNYPPIFKTPAYNYFYVEILQYQPDSKKILFNIPLVIAVLVVWSIIWVFLIKEKYLHGRVIWNNVLPWFSAIPWIWAGLLLFSGIKIFFSRRKAFRNVMTIGGGKQVIGGIADAFITGMYIHAAGLGSEIIHGKGLNYYASGHIDPFLHGENSWHSGFLLILTALNTGGATVCALSDYMQMKGVSRAYESTLWILPMYSKCTAAIAEYSHLVSALIFGGLMFSYLTTAFISIKSALHIIFEYKVKLVFVEQYVVAAVIIFCTLCSLCFTTNNGLPMLEALDTVITGIAMPLICAIESFGMIYLYRSFDFISDMNIATEENDCSARLGIQWQILPVLCVVVTVIKSVWIARTSEIPSRYMWGAMGVLALLLLALPARALYNAMVYLRPPRR